MYFKRLEIFGFKSFADKMVLNFEPGITAIVGPNGCGKSNVFDSIRWVLGEQSVKELRGSSMEDVIFNGTDKRPGLGFAEVSLTFSNESRSLAIEYDEVTISRRLFRSGESEYLINKSPVRLKDIAELLMGTGIGAEAYSMVQQGRVDLVVSAKPEDRRIILDEASGITKYKTKKREALNRLKDTENNLLRINDIVVEVKKQIATTERQAKKAQKYKEEFEQLKGYEFVLAGYLLSQLEAEKQGLETKSRELKEHETQLAAQIEEITNLIEYESGLLQDLEEKINEYKSQEIRMANDIELNVRQVGFNEERIESLNDNAQRLVQQKKQLEERCAIHQQKIDELSRELAQLKETIALHDENLARKKEDLSGLLKTIEEAKSAIKADEQKIFDLNSRQVSIKNHLTEVMKEIQGCLARKRRLEVENTKVYSEKLEAESKLSTIDENILQSLTAFAALRERFAAEQGVLYESKIKLDAAERSLVELEKKKLFLVSQKEFIEKLLVQYQDNPDPVVETRFFSALPPLEKYGAIIGKVKQVVDVAPERLDQLKAQFSEYNVEKLYEIICETKFIEQNPEDVEAKIAALEQNILDATASIHQIEEEVAHQSNRVEELSKEILTQEKTLSVFETQKTSVVQETGKLIGELDLIIRELAETETSLATFNDKEAQLGSQLDTMIQDLKRCQQEIRERQDAIAAQSRQREEVSIVIAQMETELQSWKDKEASHGEILRGFNETFESDRAQVNVIDGESADIEAKQRKISIEIEELKFKIEELKVSKESFHSSYSDFDIQRVEKSQRINSCRAQHSSLHNQLETAKTELHGHQFKEQEISYKQQSIKDRLFQTYRISFDETPVQENAESQTQPEINIEELNLSIETLRKRCEGYGAVNLVAIEEYEELKTRFEFLTKQQSDLLTARESLMQTISKINRETKDMFMETFAKVSEEFRVHFRMLFGGGEGQLVLLDLDNVLECGIDIIARPPGKKLQNISLMSGGEKTLTAIALIFAVFKVNPSPFCVLDEIDAALDESNVGRFAYMLKEFAKIAQFIVITHNKKTIAHADVMYGVTMQETGVSKLVSAKFKQEKAVVEPAEPLVAAAG
ncbi:MAG: AAA family ATPase [Candidatus Omnitrophica bacterium]|nr:AAA family ATPase [Candidatus Omnitrophota bacterium]